MMVGGGGGGGGAGMSARMSFERPLTAGVSAVASFWIDWMVSGGSVFAPGACSPHASERASISQRLFPFSQK